MCPIKHIHGACVVISKYGQQHEACSYTCSLCRIVSDYIIEAQTSPTFSLPFKLSFRNTPFLIFSPIWLTYRAMLMNRKHCVGTNDKQHFIVYYCVHTCSYHFYNSWYYTSNFQVLNFGEKHSHVQTFWYKMTKIEQISKF